MQNKEDRGVSTVSTRAARSVRFRWTGAAVTFLFFVAAFCIAQNDRPAANPGLPTAGSQAQATSDQAEAKENQAEEQKAGAPDNLRKRQIADESTQLLAMAIALKAEVDKTNKDMLSLNVIRKADEIEKLARTVKEKIKQSAGPG